MTEGSTKRGAELEEVRYVRTVYRRIDAEKDGRHRQMLVECGEVFRNVNDLNVINEGTEYTMKVASARTAQSEAIRNDLRGVP